MAKDLYVIAEQRDGHIQKVSLELLGEATKLAKELGENVVGVILGSDIKDKAQELIEHGASKVIVVDDPMLAEYVTEPYAKALTALIKNYEPNIVLFGATSIGRDIAPRVCC
jgi:electron transfer flavoprotein alpha subunit